MRLQKFVGVAAGLLAVGGPALAQTETNPGRPATAAPSAPAAVNVKPADVAPFFNFSDTSIGYRWQPLSAEPAVRQPNNPKGADINKNIIGFTHADSYKYGSNFVNLEFLKSSSPDLDRQAKNGAEEFYFVYRGQLSPNSIFNTTAFSFGPVREVTFEAGFDHNTKNTTFGSYKWLFVTGPNIHFNVPGFLNLGIHYAHEWNHNGIVGKKVDFDGTLELEMVYQFPLTFTGVPLRVEGFTNYITPKGRDGFGAKTQEEVLSQNRLTLDVGALVMNKPSVLDASVGFQYWYNKFGNDHTRTPGSIELTPFVSTRVHF